MRNRNGLLAGVLILGCSLLAGGCVDALGKGAATGLSDGIAAVIEGFITNAAASLRGDGD